MMNLSTTTVFESTVDAKTTPSEYGLSDPYGINRIPALVFSSLLIFIGTIGNGHALFLNIQRYRQQKSTRQRKNPYVVFVLSLAILDLFSCIIILPIDIIDTVREFTLLPEILCKAFRYFQFFLHISSVLHVVLICIHCWRRMCYPQRRQIERVLAIKLCSGCHIGAVLIGIPSAELSGYSTKTVNGKSGPICFTNDNYDGSIFPKLYLGFLSISFFICFIIICSSYAALIRFHWQGRHQRKSVSESTVQKKESGKTTTTLIILTLIFLGSYIPFMILGFVVVINRNFRKGWNIATFATYRVFARFPHLNNVLNPLVYGCTDREFIQRLKTMYAPLTQRCSILKQNEFQMEQSN